MFKKIVCFFIFLFLPLLWLLPGCDRSSPDPEGSQTGEVYVWSHNDYEQEEPLVRALELGFQMIEADVHLIDGTLYVTHDHPGDPEATPQLGELYLEPLRKVIEQNGGVVLPESTVPFYLVIDVKTEAGPTYERLLKEIEPYREYVTRKESGQWIESAVRLLISGNRPEPDPEAPNRMVFIDGRIPDIGEGLSPELYPVISDNWNNYFSWNGTGPIPEEEREQLQTLAEQVHAEGKVLRFWATPDNEQVWDVLLDAGVDILNVDDQEGVRRFLDRRL